MVKIKDKSLDSGSYYNRKCVIKSIESDYLALVEIIDNGEQIKIDQKFLETVIPVIFFLLSNKKLFKLCGV